MKIHEEVISINDESLYEKAKESLERNSFALVSDAYSPFELELITFLFRKIEAEGPQRHPEWCSWKNNELWAVRHVLELYPELMKLTFTHRALGLLPRLLNAPALCCGHTLMVKSPEQQGESPESWHQDNGQIVDRHLGDDDDKGYSTPLKKRRMHRDVLKQMCEARIHIEEQTIENGCLHVIPGSANWGSGKIDDSTSFEDFLSQVEDANVQVEDLEPVAVPSPAGSVLFMRPMIAHASGPCMRPAGEGTRRRVVQAEFIPKGLTPGDGSLFYPWTYPGEITEKGVFFERPDAQKS